MKQIETEEDYIRALARPKRIILIEDDEGVQQAFKYRTRGYNISISTFGDAETALASFKPGIYDLAIIDLRLPGMGGIDLFKHIYDMDREILVCILSGYIDPRVREELKGYSIVAFIEKPVGLADGSIDDLFRRLGFKEIYQLPHAESM
jgi:two-component system, LuxR family, response regulator DctR